MRYDKFESCEAGRLGGTIVTGTGVNTGIYGRILVVNAAVFTTLTGNLTGALGATTVPAGTVIVGYFTVVTLASGVVILYNAE
jgi:hypothetical protein